jgi:cytochrome c biogenesis protein CcmG/thiol:disulfide interchange protein DsbE
MTPWRRNRWVRAAGVAVLVATWPACNSHVAPPEPTETPSLDFVMADMAGNEVALADFKGKPLLINFWATWCGPCKIEMPWFVEFQRKYRDNGFTVVAVSLDEEGWQAVNPFVEGLKPNFPVVVGDDEMAKNFGGIAALPTTFLIDREGKIRRQHTGLVGADEVEEGIKELLELR